MSFKLTIGRVAIASRDLYTNEAIAALIPSDSLSNDYLYYGLQFWNLLEDIDIAVKGSTLNKRKLKKIPVFFPSSLTEQKQIVGVLSAVEAAIDTAEALLAKLARIKQGLMQDLLTKGIDERGKMRSEKTHKFKDSPLGRIPDEWSVLTLGSVAESLIDGPFGSNLKTEHYVSDSGVRVVRLQNLDVGIYDDSDKAFVSEAWASRLRRHQVVSGDVLVAAMGDDNHPTARACLYPTKLPPAINKADCFRLRCRPAVMLNAFAMYSLNSQYCKPAIATLVQGVTRMRINVTNIKKVGLKVPPVCEQERLLERLHSMDEVVERNVATLRKLRSLKLGLIVDLLTGKVRVNSLLKQ